MAPHRSQPQRRVPRRTSHRCAADHHTDSGGAGPPGRRRDAHHDSDRRGRGAEDRGVDTRREDSCACRRRNANHDRTAAGKRCRRGRPAGLPPPRRPELHARRQLHPRSGQRQRHLSERAAGHPGQRRRGRSHRCRPCAAAPVGEPVGRVPGPGGRRPGGGGPGRHPRWPASAGRRRPRGPSTQPAGHPRAQWFGQVDPARCARGYAARRHGTGAVRQAGPLADPRRGVGAGRGRGGRALYDDYDELRQRIGLVPQDDILHPQLRVRPALSYAARLRFPPDVPRSDRDGRVAEVLDELGLAAQAEQRIASLSGGQRKRTSLALELLTRPSLLFLDEPTSGLDPGLDKQVMRTLRVLADAGRTVVVVTHSVLNLDTCDQLVVLAPGGRVAYQGPPERVLGYFGVADFAEVFLMLENDMSVDWPGRFRSSDLNRPAPLSPSHQPTPASAPARRGSGLVQYRVLCRRTIDVLLADRAYLAFLVLLPVLLSGLAHATPSRRGLSTAAGAVPVEARQLLLVLILGGALMGTASSIRELVKERTIYQRERAIGLSSVAYLSAKITVLGAVTTLQAVAFAALSMLGRPGPDAAVLVHPAKVEIGLAVVAVTVASMVVGLTISTFISNADRGMPLLVMAVMLQFVLSGGLFALADRL